MHQKDPMNNDDYVRSKQELGFDIRKVKVLDQWVTGWIVEEDDDWNTYTLEFVSNGKWVQVTGDKSAFRRT